MLNILNRAKPRNYQLDLLDWGRERELRATDPNARRIARQYGLPIYQAAVIAQLAGLGEQSR
jgi:hypothetical protein